MRKKSSKPKTLGIFTGKKEEKNRLILKSLSFGPKKTMQIAEYIYLNQANAPKVVNQNEVRSINSIICRKNARIDEMSSKGYIERKNDLWALSSKGTSVALTLFNNFDDLRKLVDFHSLQNQFRTAVTKVKRHPVIAIITAPHQDNTLKDQYDRMEKEERFVEEFITKLRDFTSEMIREGVNLDTMSNRKFQIIMASEISSWMEDNFL
jgi:hypothetical protein